MREQSLVEFAVSHLIILLKYPGSPSYCLNVITTRQKEAPDA